VNEKQDRTRVAENSQLKAKIIAAEKHLFDKLSNLDPKSLNISENNRRKLVFKIADLKRVLRLYGNLLYLSLNNRQISLKESVLVDYGGGTGLISFLGAEIGIGTIIYIDIYEISCMDARTLSNATGLTLDHVVCGDVEELVSYLDSNSISIDAITSYDVLEHIYDVESHFKKLSSLSNSKFRVVYASGANTAFPVYVRSVIKKQIRTEYGDRAKEWKGKESDLPQGYLELRENLISEYATELDHKTVEQLAHLTRGLIRQDIEKCVDEFRLHGKITYHIDHPTNTCHPYTGNWCEHLIDFEWLKRVIENAGFSVEIKPGCYTTGGSLLRKSVKAMLNSIIPFLGRWGMMVVPYYVVRADFPNDRI